jgi:hypothetical protein
LFNLLLVFRRASKEIKEIVTEQPAPQVASNNGEWKHGILECCDVHHDCILAFCFCPCYGYCAAQAAGDSITASVCNCLFFPLCLCCLRQKVRLLRNIEVCALKEYAKVKI